MGFLPVQCRGGEGVSENSSLSCAEKHGLDKIEIYIWDHNKERLYERAVETIDSETEK